MSIEQELRRFAREIAARAEQQVAHLENEVLELQQRLAEKKAECDAARGAPKRLSNYDVSLGADYQCPRCWIEHERRSPLRPVPSDVGDIDIFRCRICREEFEVRVFC